MVAFLLAVTTPAVPVSGFANSVLGGITAQLVAILPYAAAITAFAVGVGMVKRWLGHASATSMGYDDDYDDGYDDIEVVYRGETYTKYKFKNRPGGYLGSDQGVGGPKGMRY